MDVYGLLNLKEDDFLNFPLLAHFVADHQIEKVVKQNLVKLKQIEESALVDKQLSVSNQSVDEVIQKVIRLANIGNDDAGNWTIRELRIVSYYLMKLRNNSEHFLFAIKLLDNNWKNLYFNGLVFYLLNSWHFIESDHREIICQLVVSKLQQYRDNNKRYLSLKKHLNLLEPTGPIRMAALLKQNNIDLFEAPTLLGYRTSALNASYYSDVILYYFKDKRITDFGVLDAIFKIHNLDRTRKLLLAHLVEKEDEQHDAVNRSNLCRYINENMGDVTLSSTWAPFIGATQEEADRLKSAMKKVNVWFNQQIIKTFFNLCVQDKERKDFWLKYAKYIDGFKIVGSHVVKSLLRSNEKIGDLFSKHFILTNSQTSLTSALILFINNKMIVEFSDTGALYVYNKDHEKVKLVLRNRQNIYSTNDLKVPSMTPLISSDDWEGYYTFYEEGRMTHQGYWVKRLRKWMNEVVLSSENHEQSFINRDDDIVFKARPLN